MINKNISGYRTFEKVFKRNGTRVRGLWKRGELYYAQITILSSCNNKKVRRISLKANNLTDAIHEMHLLKQDNKNLSPALLQDISFTQYADAYLKRISKLNSKSSNTLKSEKYMLAFWKGTLGNISLRNIQRASLEKGIQKRINKKNSLRTINLSLTVISNVLNEAIKDGIIIENTAKLITKRKVPKPDRSHFITKEIDSLCHAAKIKLKYGERFSDFIKFLCFSGARVSEGLCASWQDVDWDNQQLIIGADGKTKNSQSRRIDLNSDLFGILKKMSAKRAHEKWLFPSTMRGREQEHARTFKESLNITRRAAGLNTFTFHACRRYFISQAVMSGIDYMTIANWVGHNDGGILIGKVYGHLSRKHMKIQASRFRTQ